MLRQGLESVSLGDPSCRPSPGNAAEEAVSEEEWGCFGEQGSWARDPAGVDQARRRRRRRGEIQAAGAAVQRPWGRWSLA
jgi:hypothetical protein